MEDDSENNMDKTKQLPPIAVLDEHPDWLTPLYEAFTERGIPFVKIDISESSYNPMSTDILPFYINRLSPSASKRGHEAAFSYALNYIKYLEDLGARVVNGSHTVLMETSKAQQAALLRKLNISQPKSIALNDISQIEKHIDEFTFPVVIKPNRGGSGMGIQKYISKEEILQAVKDKTIPMPLDNLVLLQEFIQPKDGYIVRVETVNGKVMYAMKVFTKGTFNLCPSDSCDLQRGPEVTDDLGYCVATPTDDVKFELYENPPADVVEAVEKIVKEAGIECGGVEYVVGEDGKWYIYDINALSILRASFKEDYGIDGWGMLADFFIEEYKKVVK